MNVHVSPLEAAEQLAKEFELTAAETDRSGRLSPGHTIRLRDAGLLGLTAPVRFGGQGARLAEAVRIVGAIAKGEPSLALILAMQYINLATLPHGKWPTDLVNNVLTMATGRGALINALRVEPELGTPLRGGLPATSARRVEQGWAISGRKIYSTGSRWLTWGIVWARTDESVPRVGAFLVPMVEQGIRIEPTWDQAGMRATESHDVIFDNVLVPETHAADIRFPEEWSDSRDPLTGAWGALLIAAIYDAVAQAATDWTRNFLLHRVPTGLGKPLASLPRIQQAFGAIQQQLAVSSRLLASAARDIDDGAPLRVEEPNLIKVAVTEGAIAIVDACLKLTGNHGLSRSNPLERHQRNVLCGRIHSPQEDTVHVSVGRQALTV